MLRWPYHRQVADRDLARRIRHARDRLEVVRQKLALLAGPKDAKEGLKAFGERRKASWPWK